jgi:hypothetical protein
MGSHQWQMQVKLLVLIPGYLPPFLTAELIAGVLPSQSMSAMWPFPYDRLFISTVKNAGKFHVLLQTWTDLHLSPFLTGVLIDSL